MPPPFLFLNNMSPGGPAVYRYDGATTTQIGNTIGTGVLETPSPDYMGKNRVIQFQNSLYAVQNLGVYKLQGDDVTWSSTVPNGGLPFTSPISGTRSVHRSGLYPITINGASFLICAFFNASNQLIIATMDAATNTWSETGALLTSATLQDPGGFYTEIVYENKFYLSHRELGGSFRSYRYDPTLGTAASLTNPVPVVADSVPDTCIHNGRLFMSYITASDTSGRYHLAEFTGGVWVDLGRVSPDLNHGNGVDLLENRTALMSDGTNLYYFFPTSGLSKAYFAIEITDPDSLPGTEISTTVLPAAILTAPNDDNRLTHAVDTQTTPGTPVHYFYHSISATAGTARQLYLWNGNASLMTTVGGSGGDVAHAIPTACSAGGERIFSTVAVDNDILITSRTTVSGGIQVTFRAYSPGGTESGTVRIWISTEGEPVSTQAVLSAPVTGGSAVLSGNTIVTVTADGTTDYTVVVPSTANSFSNLTQVDLVPEFI